LVSILTACFEFIARSQRTTSSYIEEAVLRTAFSLQLNLPNRRKRMGYSDSAKTLDEIRPLLSSLEKGQGTAWTVPEGMKPAKFAHKIREALHIARLYPERYPQLAKAAQTFKIQIVNSRQVQAVLTDKQTGLGLVREYSPAQHGLETAGPIPHKVMGQQSADSIIMHINRLQQTQPSNATMSWPQADLSHEDKIRLLRWCGKQTPAWILLVSGQQITISRKTKDLTEQDQWSPEDE
jgi:hypothetical protein